MFTAWYKRWHLSLELGFRGKYFFINTSVMLSENHCFTKQYQQIGLDVTTILLPSGKANDWGSIH